MRSHEERVVETKRRIAAMERLTIKSQARNEMVVVKKDGSERV